VSTPTATSAPNSPPAAGSRAAPQRQVRLRIASELLALAYIAIIAAIADLTGAFYVLFPELGALAYDVLTRPRGRWCSAPLHLATTPALTGAMGIAITRTLPYGLPAILANVAAALVAMLWVGSPIGPSISAGLLPLVLDVQSWWYPPGVLLAGILLAGISLVWRPFLLDRGYLGLPIDGDDESTPVVEPRALQWIPALFAFVAVATGLVYLTGNRFILFPPLVVIAYEMMRHPARCPWARRALRLPIVCFLAAAGGLLFHGLVGVNPLCAALSMAWGIVVVRALDAHVPPALAVALLPMVMTAPTVAYPVAVAFGTALLLAWFAVYRRLVLPDGRA
jgi:hypothetical protein